jgi:hypothetical protein
MLAIGLRINPYEYRCQDTRASLGHYPPLHAVVKNGRLAGLRRPLS